MTAATSNAGRLERLRTAVEKHWETQAGDIATSFAGAPLDATRRREWVEIWLAAEDVLASRRAVATSRVTLTTHVFVRESTDARAAERIVDCVRDAFAGRTLDAGEGLCLRLKEAEVRDLTRKRSEESPALLRHLVVLIEGDAVA